MRYKITLNGKIYEVEVEQGEPILIDEYDAFAPVAPVSVTQVSTPVASPAPASAPTPAAAAPAASTPTPKAAAAPTVSAGEEVVVSPLPGKVFKILVNQGDAVTNGQVLLIIEAMKMENEVFASRDGSVTQISTEVGAAVKTGDPLLVLG